FILLYIHFFPYYIIFLLALCCSDVVFVLFHLLIFSVIRRPPISPLFPYTTLFRSYLERLLNKSQADTAHASSPQSTITEAFLAEDRKSTRLNSSHVSISYAVFCLKKKIIANYSNIK